jgi:excisionase family DNA binding protein
MGRVKCPITMDFPQNAQTVLLDVAEVSRRLSVTPRTVGRYITSGRLRCIKLGTHKQARRRISEADLLAFIEEARRS